MKKYKSEIYKVMHEDAKADFEVGGITEERMRYYDEICLVKESEPVYKKEPAEDIKHASPVAI